MSIFGTGKNNNLEPEIVALSEPIKATGLTIKTDMKNIFGDVTKITKTYMSYKNKYGIPNQKKPWEYVSLSDYFDENKAWDYSTGHVVTDTDSDISEVFISFEIPIGTYAVFPIRPKSKLLLGLTIGKTKQYIYNNWLLKSKYEFAGYEFEYNNEKMCQESPTFIDLYVGVKDKNQ